MELDARVRDLHLVHLVGVGEGERAVEVAVVAVLTDIARGHSPVAVDGGRDVAHVDAAIAAVVYQGADVADGQLAALLTAHDASTRLGDVYLEVGRGFQTAYLLHLHHLAQVEGLRADVACQVFVQPVDGQQEVEGPCCRAQRALEYFALIQYGELSCVGDVAQVVHLLDHQFLHGELVDNLLLDVALGRHLAHVEAYVELLLVLQVVDVARGLDAQLLVVGGDKYVAECHRRVRAAHAYAQVQRHGELGQRWCEGARDVSQDGLALDGAGGVGELAASLLAGQCQLCLGYLQLGVPLLQHDVAQVDLLLGGLEGSVQVAYVEACHGVLGGHLCQTARHHALADGVDGQPQVGRDVHVLGIEISLVGLATILARLMVVVLVVQLADVHQQASPFLYG